MMGQEIWKGSALEQLLDSKVCSIGPICTLWLLRFKSLCGMSMLYSSCSQHDGLGSRCYDFLDNSKKRFAFLEKQIKGILPNAKHPHLFDVCHMQWVARLDGLDVFVQLFVPLTQCLDAAELNQDGIWIMEMVRNASGLFRWVTPFQLILCLIAVSCCLEVTQPLTKQLQSSAFDVVAANERVVLLYTAL